MAGVKCAPSVGKHRARLPVIRTGNGEPARTRTSNRPIWNRVLCQLSYRNMKVDAATQEVSRGVGGKELGGQSGR